MSDLHGTPCGSSPFDQRLAELARTAAGVARPESPAAVRLRAGRRTLRRRVGTGVLAVAVLGAVAAGGALRPSADDAVPPALTPPPATRPSTAVPTTPSPTVVSPSATASPQAPRSPAGTVGARPPGTPGSTPGRCTTAQLTVTLGAQDAASGHRSVAVVFRNSGGTTCRLTGYPGVDALGGDGRTLAHAERTPDGYMGGPERSGRPPTVTLRPGGSASALVEALGFRPADGAACEPYVSLLVTPPDDVRSVRLRWATDSCSELEVHPVVAGTTGRSG